MVRRYRRGIWLLAALLLLTRMVPLHMHFHHTDSPASATSSHTLDVHAHAATGLSDHQHDDDTHVIDLNQATLIKQFDADSPLVWLLTCLLVICLARLLTKPTWTPIGSSNGPPQSFFLLSPPLRAPPRY